MPPLLDGAVALIITGAVALFAIVIVAAIRAAKKEKERKLAVSNWAKAQGYTCIATDDHSSHQRYLYFDALNAGANQYFQLQIRGEFQSLPFLLFDYHYETYSTDKDGHRTTHHHHVTGCIIETGLRFPAELKLRPEHFFDKLKSAVGFNDIDFESAEFSKKFHVVSKDRKFAYDFIHQKMMEYLLEHPKTSFEIEHNAIMVGNGKTHLQAEGYAELLRHARHILEMTPDYFIEQSKMEG